MRRNETTHALANSAKTFGARFLQRRHSFVLIARRFGGHGIALLSQRQQRIQLLVLRIGRWPRLSIERKKGLG